METITAVKALAALAQPTRLDVFRMLVEAGPSGLAAGEIAQAQDVAPATLSFHLKELAHASLVLSRQEGRYIFYSANYAAMNALLSFMTENCCARDGLDCAQPSCAAPASPRRRATRKA